MTATTKSRTTKKEPAGLAERTRPLLLGFVAARAVLGVVAVLLVPWLYDDHLVLLVLLRPTKEVLLYSGYAVRENDANMFVLVIAALPLLLFAVWGFYALGKSYKRELATADLPGLAGKLLPRERIHRLSDTIAERGWVIVFLGRLAFMPSTLVAAAAGSSDMPTRTFLLADAAGAVASLAMLMGAGFVLGNAYDDAGPWATAVGAVILVGLLVLLGRTLRGAKSSKGSKRK